VTVALALVKASNGAVTVLHAVSPDRGDRPAQAFLLILVKSPTARAPIEEETDYRERALSLLTVLRYPRGFRVVLSLQYLWDLADYREEIGLYAPGARLRLCFPSPFFRNEPTPVVLSGTEGEAAWEKRVVASRREAFKEELIHFAECVRDGRVPTTSVEDGRADVAVHSAKDLPAQVPEGLDLAVHHTLSHGGTVLPVTSSPDLAPVEVAFRREHDLGEQLPEEGTDATVRHHQPHHAGQKAEVVGEPAAARDRGAQLVFAR